MSEEDQARSVLELAKVLGITPQDAAALTWSRLHEIMAARGVDLNELLRDALDQK